VVINRERLRADGTLPGDPSCTRSLRRLRVAHSAVCEVLRCVVSQVFSTSMSV